VFRRVVHKADFLGLPGVTQKCLDDSIKHGDRKFQSLPGPHSLAGEHPANCHDAVFFLESGALLAAFGDSALAPDSGGVDSAKKVIHIDS